METGFNILQLSFECTGSHHNNNVDNNNNTLKTFIIVAKLNLVEKYYREVCYIQNNVQSKYLKNNIFNPSDDYTDKNEVDLIV